MTTSAYIPKISKIGAVVLSQTYLKKIRITTHQIARGSEAMEGALCFSVALASVVCWSSLRHILAFRPPHTTAGGLVQHNCCACVGFAFGEPKPACGRF